MLDQPDERCLAVILCRWGRVRRRKPILDADARHLDRIGDPFQERVPVRCAAKYETTAVNVHEHASGALTGNDVERNRVRDSDV